MYVYADHAATTPLSPAALAAMTACLRDDYGNPSSLHTPGQHARELLDQGRLPGRRPRGDLLHLRRQRGRQPGPPHRRGPGGQKGQKAPDHHRL